MCECGCPHLLPWEETSAAGCQRPPVRVHPAAADWLACRTDPLSAGAEAAAEEICMRRNSCLIRQTFGPPSEMLWVCPACTNERRVCWTGNLLCMLEVTDWQGFHAAESLKNNVEMVSNVAEMSNISWRHNSWDREKIYTWQLCKILQINNNVSKHSAHSVMAISPSLSLHLTDALAPNSVHVLMLRGWILLTPSGRSVITLMISWLFISASAVL